MEGIQDFIYELENNQRDIMQYLHDLMLTFPDLTGKIRYKVPFYYRKSWMYYMNPQKEDTVELCFLRGNELSNVQDLLDFKDRKQVGGITFASVQDIKTIEEPLFELLQEVFLLDDTVPYASKRKKKM